MSDESRSDSQRRWWRDPNWWRRFIARRKRSRIRWWRDWWTRVDQKVRWPDA